MCFIFIILLSSVILSIGLMLSQFEIHNLNAVIKNSFKRTFGFHYNHSKTFLTFRKNLQFIEFHFISFSLLILPTPNIQKPLLYIQIIVIRNSKDNSTYRGQYLP